MKVIFKKASANVLHCVFFNGIVRMLKCVRSCTFGLITNVNTCQ